MEEIKYEHRKFDKFDAARDLNSDHKRYGHSQELTATCNITRECETYIFRNNKVGQLERYNEH
eukprot:14195742-Heterocapsa_arctica.AAC.1